VNLWILGFSPIVILLNPVGSHFFCGFQSVFMHNVITIIRVCCYICLKTLVVYNDCVSAKFIGLTFSEFQAVKMFCNF